MLSDAQYIPLVVLGTLSSTLSFFGSCCIVYMSYPKLRTEIKQRLLFCLSFADLFMSASTIAMPLAIPSYLGLPGAVGTHASCTVAGFVFSAAGKTSCYCSTYLSFYFLLLVRYNWKESYFTWTLELMAHLIPLTYIFGVEIAAAATQSINPTPLFNSLCMYSEVPWGCGSDGLPCERSSGETVDKMLNLAFPFWIFCSLLSFISTALVFVAVRKTFGKNRIYRFESTLASSSQNNATMDMSSANLTVVDPNQERLRQVGIQAISYFLTYLNALFWPTLVVVVTSSKDQMEIATTLKLKPGVYCLQIFFWAFFPLQGFLNFFVYTRAKHHEWRKRQPEVSGLWIYQQIVLGADVPTTTSMRHRSYSSAKAAPLQRNSNSSTREGKDTPCNRSEQETEQGQMA